MSSNKGNGVISVTRANDTVGGTNFSYQTWVDVNGNDLTGKIGNASRPFATMDAALTALNAVADQFTLKVVRVGIGTFASPSSTAVLSSTAILGSGKPAFNNPITGGATYPNVTSVAPTKLIAGTIFQGTFRIAGTSSNITLCDFGVDVGSDFIGGGAAQEGLILANGSNDPQFGKVLRSNLILNNLSVLQKDGTSLVHACDIENCYNPIANNITTWGGFAGFVSKNVGGRFTNIQASASSTYSIIIKQNDYAYSYATILDGFRINGGAGLGLFNENGSANGMQAILVTNGEILNATYGIADMGNGLTFCNISNIMIMFAVNNGIQFQQFLYGQIINCTVVGCGNVGISVLNGAKVTVTNNYCLSNAVIDLALTGFSATDPLYYNDNVAAVTSIGANTIDRS